MQSWLQHKYIHKTVKELHAVSTVQNLPRPYESRRYVGRNSDGSHDAEDNNVASSHQGLDDVSTRRPSLVDREHLADPLNPRNWSMTRKIFVTFIIWINVFAVNWASGANSQINALAANEFGVPQDVETLSSALYVLGVAMGALTAGPIAESLGRNPLYIASRLAHVAFMLGTAMATNIQTQLCCRFAAGLGASSIIAIHGASIADLFDAYERSVALPFVACGSFFGTSLSPVLGGWMAEAAENGELWWRWSDWIAAVMSAFTFLLAALFLPETFAPALLKWKAAALRQYSGDDRFVSKMELQETFLSRLRVAFERAWQMTIHEPIVQLLGMWIVVVFVVLFGFLRGFGFLFQVTFGFSDGLKGSAFAGVAVGVAVYSLISILFQRRYKRQMKAWGRNKADSGPLPPEHRLPPAYAGAFTFPFSMFCLGLVNYSTLSVWWSLICVALFGFSWAAIAVPANQYLLDVYGVYAGSALASITCYRYAVAAGITMVSGSMYQRLGIHWTCALLGGLALLLAPAPFLFHSYGPKIRAKSRFASQT